MAWNGRNVGFLTFRLTKALLTAEAVQLCMQNNPRKLNGKVLGHYILLKGQLLQEYKESNFFALDHSGCKASHPIPPKLCVVILGFGLVP